MTEVVQQRIIDAGLDVVTAEVGGAGSRLEEAAERAGRQAQALGVELDAELGRKPLRMRVHKRVRLNFGPVQELPDRRAVAITWEASGYGGLFPIMEALVELHPLARTKTLLLFWGRYDPPLGRVGDLADRVVAHRVAEATVSNLLDLIAEAAELAEGIRSAG